jgi:hypothetical protein
MHGVAPAAIRSGRHAGSVIAMVELVHRACETGVLGDHTGRRGPAADARTVQRQVARTRTVEGSAGGRADGFGQACGAARVGFPSDQDRAAGGEGVACGVVELQAQRRAASTELGDI